METDKFVVESEVQLYEQKICQICKDINCWGEATHDQPAEKNVEENSEDSSKKNKKTLSENPWKI